jgi:uncharacterized membrane protein
VNPLLRAALAGAATGDRSCVGIAALALSAPSQATTQPDKTLSKRWVQGLAALLATQEIVLDKLPQTPSRLEPLGLGLRCVAAAAAGVTIARRNPAAVTSAAASGTADDAEPVPPGPTVASAAACAAVATVVTVGSAWLGVRWRSWAAARTGHDFIGASLEDATALSLAWLAARTPADQLLMAPLPAN